MKRLGLILSLTAALVVPSFGQYCAAALNCACSVPFFDEYIANVTLGGLNNSSGCQPSPSYSDFTAVPGANLSVGVATPINVTVGYFWGTDAIFVFCDWDGNGILNDPGEVTVIPDPANATPSGTGVNNPGYTAMLTPPAGSVSSVRMRVILRYNTLVPDPCPTTATSPFGEIEDYTITVGGGGPTPCSLYFSSPLGAGSVQMDNMPCPAVAGADYVNAITLYTDGNPGGWFFGIDIPMAELLNEFNAGYPFKGTLDGAGASSFGPIPGAPSGLTIYAVSVQFAPGFGPFLFARPAVAYTIP